MLLMHENRAGTWTYLLSEPMLSRPLIAVLLLRRALFLPLRLSMVSNTGNVLQAETRSLRRLLELYFANRARGYLAQPVQRVEVGWWAERRT